MFWWHLFFFFSCNLRAPWADRSEILHDARTCVRFYNPGPKFRGGLPRKILRTQNMQNLACFRTTKRMKIFKIGELLDLPQFLRRSAKKVR